jgi:hypothetical protein
MSDHIEMQTFNLTVTPHTNLELISTAYFKPRAPMPNPIYIAAFQKTALHAMSTYLYDYEIDHILNDYRRTTFDEESIERDFFSGDIEQFKVIKDDVYYRALERTRIAFAPPQKYRPVHLLDIQHHYPLKPNTNAERPFSTDPFFLRQLNDPGYRERHSPPLPENPRPSTGNMKNIIFDYVREWLHEIKNAAVPYDRYLFSALLHSKSALVESNDPNKIRTIFGTPKPAVLAEIMFYWPLFNYYKRNFWNAPLLWGFETLTGGWFRLNDELMRTYLRATILMIDYSRFDKYTYYEVFDDLEPIYESYIDFEHGYIPTRDYQDTQRDWTHNKAQRLRRLFQWTNYAFRNTPITIFDGRVYRRRFASIPSGIYTTQFRDSTYNYLMIATLLLHFMLEWTLLRVQGDDSITKLTVSIPPNQHGPLLQQLALEAKRRFNSIVNVVKSKISNLPTQAEVLGYTNNHGMPYRDPNQVLAQWYHTKDSHPTPERAMAACQGYAYALCNTSRRHYDTLRDAWLYYKSRHVTPEVSYVTEILPPQLYGYINPTQHFPRWQDIDRYLFEFNYDSSRTLDKFWDNDWFLSEF